VQRKGGANDPFKARQFPAHVAQRAGDMFDPGSWCGDAPVRCFGSVALGNAGGPVR